MAEAPWRSAAPPPPLGVGGHIPSTRLKSEISDRRVEPPLCVQNAMLTKDKKPFTYTPGGIDLSEIRSPRMARRLERNAMNEGVAAPPQTQAPQYSGSLPPSALAAMQPQMPVQVFPAGGIPQSHHHGGGAPPPPPPPCNIPPPPKAPPMRSTSPVPLDAFERPDMTKIIPENPMSLLRKTSGPVIKRDPIFNKNSFGSNDRADRPVQRAETDFNRQPESPSTKVSTTGLGSIYVPPVNQNAAPSTPQHWQPQSPQQVNQSESPSANTVRAPPAYYKRQPSTPQSEPQTPPFVPQKQPAPSLSQAREEPQSPESPKVSLSKAPTPWLTQKRPQQQEAPEWAVNNNRAQTSPVIQQQKPQLQQDSVQFRQQQQEQTPPPWKQQQQESPQWQQNQPWQQRQVYQPEPQPWQQRPQQQPQSPPWQQQSPKSPPIESHQPGGVKKQVQVRESPYEPGPVDRTEVVIVNDPPQVFQHPGPTHKIIIRQQPQQNDYQQQRLESPGIRVVPVQMEGASSNGHAQSPHKFNSPGATPSTPGSNSDARSLNRQLSWNSNPTQSNTFRVLQKITQTDGNDDDDQVVIEHSPKTPHQFPQRQLSTEQMRKLRLNESDQELMNKFKQVPQSPQQNNRGPVVRTIPIQIEGDGPTKVYIPPSEQTVPEPKKYMGSSIPSRSFKILQAMTTPDGCVSPAHACENNENYPNDPSYTQWGFDPNYPPPPPYYFDPYWSYYSQNYPPPNGEGPPAPAQSNNSRATPVPMNWGYFPPCYPQNNATPVVESSSSSSTQSAKKRSASSRVTPIPWANGGESAQKQNGNPRCTPVPFWPYYYPNYPHESTPNKNQGSEESDTNENAESGEEQSTYPQYPPYWDPYYYGYYYGAPPPMYPPVYSPYIFYPPAQTDTDEVSGYSSNDEMAYYGARFAAMASLNGAKRKDASTLSLPKQVSSDMSEAENKNAEAQQDEDDDKTKIESDVGVDDETSVADTSDSDTDMVGYEVCRPPGNRLQAIRSVSDIKVYDEESSHCSDEEETSENITEENDDSSSACVADETIPHQLSVIFEESERTDSGARYVRESSVATTVSEDTQTIENSDEEEEEEAVESDGTVLVKLPLTLKFGNTKDQNLTLVVGNSQVKPQVAVKSGSAKGSVEHNDDFSKSGGSISKQISSDSFQTAESDVDIFCNTQNKKSNNICNNHQKENHDDTDWWGELGTDNTVSHPTKNHIQDKLEVSVTEDNITEGKASKDYSRYKVDEEISKSCGPEHKRSSCSSEESEVDFWAQLQSEETVTSKSKHTYIVSHVEDQEKIITPTAKNVDKENEAKVKEGMGKVEAVLTSIISTIARRTSVSYSDEEKLDEIDFWAEINSSPTPQCNNSDSKVTKSSVEIKNDAGSTCSSDSSLSSSKESLEEERCSIVNRLEGESSNRVTDENENSTFVQNDNSEESNTFVSDDNVVETEENIKLPSIQERIKALHEFAAHRQHHVQDENEEIKISVKERVSVFEDTSIALMGEKNVYKPKSVSRKNSVKSYDDCTEEEEEEEGDSGVTSDVSRHISETDTEVDYAELQKCRYQRASTHSRLFKLLQDECDNEDVPNDISEENKADCMQTRRELLNLPLQNNGSDPESFSSSGFTSPGSPTINDKLVNELIQSLLKRKRGRIFKHMPMEKVQAAALRILQEDMDGLETLSSSEDGGSFLSPKLPGTGSSTPARTPQEFYSHLNEYSQYYDSWAEAGRLYDAQCDILPSKAFRLIQEHASSNKTGAVAGLLARCPRVLSNKNVQKELLKLMESHPSPSPSPEPSEQPPLANEAESAS